jgi:hypothetical protein
MAFDPSDEIVLGVAAESRDAEVRIFDKKLAGGSTGSDDDDIVGFHFRTFAQNPPWSEDPI